MIGSIQDITEENKQSELQLEKELSQSTLICCRWYYTVDRDGIITLVNPSGEELIGRKKEIYRSNIYTSHFALVQTIKKASHGFMI